MEIIKNKLKKIISINTIRKDCPDDLYICASSFEERCREAPRRLAVSEYKTNKAIIFNYYGGRKQALRLFNRTKIVDYLSEVTLNDSIFQINCDRLDPLDGMEKIREILCVEEYKSREMAVTIDVSTFTKQYLLTLLKDVEGFLSPEYIRLIYTEPNVYGGKEDFKNLSYGLKEVIVIPGFTGEEVEGEKLLLVVFLGYEAHRTIAVIEKYEPDLLIAVIGKPPYYKGWDEFSVKTHQYLLSRPEVLKYEMSAREPGEVKNELEKISNMFYKEFPNIFISPTGTKLQTIGIYEFVKKCNIARIVYAIPKGYYESYYSLGSGEMWEYYLRKPITIENGITD